MTIKELTSGSTLDAPHEIDKTGAKYQGLVEAFATGQCVPPIVAIGDNAITGSHRIAAHYEASQRFLNGEEMMEPCLTVYELDVDEYEAACEWADSDIFELGDWNLAAEAVYETATDTDLKEALKDQIYHTN